MLKYFVIGAGVLLVLVLLAAVYAVRELRKAIAESPSVSATLVRGSATELRLRLLLSGTERKSIITSIAVPRTVRDTMGLQPPAGFKLREQQERTSSEALGVSSSDDVWFEGSFELLPGRQAFLVFPAHHVDATQGRLLFMCEARVGFGGRSDSFTVDLGASVTVAEP